MKKNANDISGFAYKPGEKIGNYEVREVLGVGGQSIVYKCYDPLLARLVAIKQIATHLAHDPKYVEQLNKSIRNLAMLGSMNEAIVTIHEMIRDDHGLFYVMEFVQGHALETVISESDGPIEPKAVLLLLFRLAAALHDVHGQGIVHRDIKPGNIIVGEGLRPKIIDFGVAAVSGSDVSMPLATTKYLAPEVYGGGAVDGRADLYSLGFIAYEMLLGREKFNEIFADILSDSRAEVLRWMKWHGNDAVTAPPAHEVNPAVPILLSQLVAKMIDKNPDNRFADTEELGRAIKGGFSGRGRFAAEQAESPAGDVMDNLAGHRGMGTLDGKDIEIHPPAPSGEVESAGPPTLPLPKQPMTRKTKITLLAIAGVIFLGICAAGVNTFMNIRDKAEARARDAREVYAQAEKKFRNENFDEALKGYESLLGGRSQTSQKAKLMTHLCRANMAILTHRWDEAQIQENAADESAKELQASAHGDDLLKWVRHRQNDIEQLSRYRYSSAVFFGATEKSDKALAGAIQPGDFDSALRDMEKTIGIGDVNLTEKQEQLLANQKNKIRRRKFLFVVADLQRRSDQLQKLQKFDQARTLLKQASAMLAGKDSSAGLIPPADRRALADDLERKTRQLDVAAHLAGAVAAVEAAAHGNDLAAMRKTLRDALKLPSLSDAQRKEYRNRLEQVRSAEQLKSARKLLAGGDLTGARQALQRVLKTSPNNEEAKAMLQDTANAAQKEKLVQSANLDFVSRKFIDALGKYEQAAKLGADERLRLRIVDCRFNIAMGRAEAFGGAGKYDQAARAYREARQIKPANAVQVDAMLLLLENQRQYSQHIARGNTALKKKNWTEATKAYEEARKIQATEEVDNRIRLTKYVKNITLGDVAMREDDLPRARFHFKLARKQMDTPEVRSKLNKAVEK